MKLLWLLWWLWWLWVVVVVLPGPLIPLYRNVNLRIFTNLDQRGVRTFPKEVPVTMKTAAKAAWNDFSLGMTEKKSTPHTSNNDASEQSLVPFSYMRCM